MSSPFFNTSTPSWTRSLTRSAASMTRDHHLFRLTCWGTHVVFPSTWLMTFGRCLGCAELLQTEKVDVSRFSWGLSPWLPLSSQWCLPLVTWINSQTPQGLGSKMKRTVGPRYWLPPVSDGAPTPKHGLQPLREGPVVQSSIEPPGLPVPATPRGQPEIKAYSRGSLDQAIQQISSRPQACEEHIREKARAQNAKGPFESRKRTWSTIANKAGFANPFNLTPELVFRVMGAMDLVGYRSPELYMETAKQIHVESGEPWAQQLALATRQAKRACQRGRGPSKQAQVLPFSQLASLKHRAETLANGGPWWPQRSILLSSWWLLREIEASAALRSHITVVEENKLIHWRLPSSKTDIQALGATRTHSCNCSSSRDPSCPYHAMIEHLEELPMDPDSFLFPTNGGKQSTKVGWSDSIQEVARSMDLPLLAENGVRKFTGHSMRATGAVHFAQTQVELWRIQLFGRWGSSVFQRYVRDAPLTQLHGLAKETSLATSLAASKAELQSVLAQVKATQDQLAQVPLRFQPVEALADCQDAQEISPEPPEAVNKQFVVNRSRQGKIHLVTRNGAHEPHFLWHTKCRWHFARSNLDYELTETKPADRKECSKCFTPVQQSSDDDSSTSSSSSWCALQVGPGWHQENSSKGVLDTWWIWISETGSSPGVTSLGQPFTKGPVQLRLLCWAPNIDLIVERDNLL